MTEKDSTDKNRRELLRDMAVLAGGATLGAGATEAARKGLSFQEIINGLEDGAENTWVTVGAATPSDEDYGQYRGGPKNQGEFTSTLSPTSIENVEEYLSGKNFIQPPTTAEINGDGWILAQTEDKMHGLNLDTEQIIQAPARSQNRIIVDDEYAYVGDEDDLRKVEIPTGNTVEKLEGILGAATTTAAPFVKDGNKAYTETSGGVIKLDLNDLENYERLDDLNQGPTTMAVFDEGSKMVLNQQSRVKTYDLDNQEEIANLNNISPKGLSVFDDDETIAGVSGSKLYVWDENLNQIDSIDKEGTSYHPPVPFIDSDSDKRIIDGSTPIDGSSLNGKVKAYTMNEGEIQLDWEKNPGGTVDGLIKYGDTVLAATSNGVFGYNQENGDELFHEITNPPFIGMPYNEKIPLTPINNGIKVLNADTGQIGGEEAELVHSWQGIPNEMQIDEAETWQHVLEETGGDSPVTGVEIKYEIEAENGEPYTVAAPLELDAGELMERDFKYNPVRTSEEFSGDFYSDINQVFVRHPVEIESDGETEATVSATPYDETNTSPERLI